MNYLGHEDTKARRKALGSRTSQYAQPDYYPATEALDLARHDSTGMWMLNYPFPYDSTAVVKPFAALSHAAREALRAGGFVDQQRAVLAQDL